MIDLHSHLLPWVDHGCPDLKTAVNMARTAAESGIQLVACTPHYPDWNLAKVQYARVVLEQLRGTLLNNGVEIFTLLGFEVDLSVVTGADLKRMRELTIEKSKQVLLLEMPYNGWPLFIEDTIFRLVTNGFTPVLAHPERNDQVQKSSEPLDRLVRGGAVVQATAGSLTGEFGNAAVKTFHRLISEGLVSLLATDAHSFRHENWTMEPMKEALEGKVSPDDWRRLTYTNPLALLKGEPLEKIEPSTGSGGGPTEPTGGRKKRWGRG
jgi:protein-tyrosine phosphatase